MKNISKKQTNIYLLPGIAIGLAFGILIYQSMSWGPWAYNDSSAYVSAARNLAAGNGSVILHSTGKIKHLTEFPPLYPFFLSIFGGQSGNYISIIRLVNSILFSLSIFLFYLIVHQLTKNTTVATISSLVYVSFKVIIEIYTGAMSEPLFLLLLFLAIFSFIKFLKGENPILGFIALIFSSALLPLTRYAGILFIGVIWFSIIFIDQTKTRRNKLLYAISYIFISALPIFIWMLTLLSKNQKFAGKRIQLNWSLFPTAMNSVKNIFRVLQKWIPYVSEYQDRWFASVLIFTVSLILFASIFYSAFLFFSKNQNNKRSEISILFSINLMIFGYFAMIAFMHSTSSPPIDIIDRTLLPVYPLLLISFITFISIKPFGGEKHFALNIFLIAISIIVLRYNYLINRPYLKTLSEKGIGFTARELQTSGIINAIQKIDDDRIMISNLSGFVLFHTNRYPILIENFPLYSFGIGETYGEPEFRQRNGALILMKSEFNNYYGDSADALYKTVTGSLVTEYEDAQGIILSFHNPTQR